MTSTTLIELWQVVIAFGFLLFALHLVTKMAGVGEKAMKQFVNALLEAIVSVLILPFKFLTWLSKKLAP